MNTKDTSNKVRHSPTLVAENVRFAYDKHPVIENLSMTLRPGEITAIIGANASGKSTLLRGLARLLRPSTGAVLIDGCDVARLPTREVATRIGVLSQLPVAPGGLSVGELVARGRYPHQGWFRQWSPEDERGVRDALAATQMSELADRRVDELSGGQRQRAWIAMALAQDTDILLLDEPTTFLDIAHQIEILDLLVDLNATSGRTIAVVLHDLNQACRYADHLIAMSCGQIAAEGRPAEILTTALVKKVFNIECRLIPDPATGLPLIVPVSSRTPLDKRTTHWCCPAPADRFGKEDQAAALRR